jgi:hypothetical protein
VARIERSSPEGAVRIAVLVLGLVLGAVMFVQTFLVYALSGVTRNIGSGQSGAIGLFMVLMWLVASALVLAVPLVSAIVFAVAGLLGFAASNDFPDLAIWGGMSFVLAVLSVIGWIGKRRTARQEAARYEQLVAVASPGRRPVPTVPCPSCGAQNVPGARFCAECGAAIAGTDTP